MVTLSSSRKSLRQQHQRQRRVCSPKVLFIAVYGISASLALIFIASFANQHDSLFRDSHNNHNNNIHELSKSDFTKKSNPSIRTPPKTQLQSTRKSTSTHKIQRDNDKHNNKLDIVPTDDGGDRYHLPPGLQQVLERANQNTMYCGNLPETTEKQQQQQQQEKPSNFTDLPTLGIAKALSSYQPASTEEAEQWQCQVPPETECQVNSFTIIFLGHNPERLQGMQQQMKGFLRQTGIMSTRVHEILVVWNGPRELSETRAGKSIQDMAEDSHTPVRVLYPLKLGYPNDLLNRYDPRLLKVETKAILYYDDDGPFYSHDAILGAFELWKRNSNTQIGAMARRLDVGKRQEVVKQTMLQGGGQSLVSEDRHFVPHCREAGDSVFYNYYQFAQFGANMVLPSGTFVHSNYLCFIWHPALEEVRQFVRAHPVHPDDATVSTIVSQVSGRAPKVYSRRMPTKRRRLLQQKQKQQAEMDDAWHLPNNNHHHNTTIHHHPEVVVPTMRRKLLWEQQGWGDMRNDAVNSLTAYFGSINSGSVGWCNGTEYHKFSKRKGHFCEPEMARIGMLPWMTPQNKPLDVCP